MREPSLQLGPTVGTQPARCGIVAAAAAATLILAAVAGQFLWRLPAQPSWTGVMLGGSEQMANTLTEMYRYGKLSL